MLMNHGTSTTGIGDGWESRDMQTGHVAHAEEALALRVSDDPGFHFYQLTIDGGPPRTGRLSIALPPDALARLATSDAARVRR